MFDMRGGCNQHQSLALICNQEPGLMSGLSIHGLDGPSAVGCGSVMGSANVWEDINGPFCKQAMFQVVYESSAPVEYYINIKGTRG